MLFVVVNFDSSKNNLLFFCSWQDASSSQSAKQQYELEQEKMLPGVVMGKGGQVFEMLYRLSDLDESK